MDTQTRTSGTDVAVLGLGSVLVGSLPAALMTDDAPDRYTVEAVFTRRPVRDEVAEILGSETRDRLARAGYPTVEVTVTDRRLEIANTNLEELRDGLAAVLANWLGQISARVRARHDGAAVRSHDVTGSERARAAAVSSLAQSITFHVSASAEAPRSAGDREAGAAKDREQIDSWRTEGGRGRWAR